MADVTDVCRMCARCRTEGTTLLRCSACKTVSYCNADCQKSDWSNHKSTCKRARTRVAAQQRHDEFGKLHGNIGDWMAVCTTCGKIQSAFPLANLCPPGTESGAQEPLRAMAQDGPAVCECGGAVERQGQNVEAIAASAIPALAPSASETDTMAALYRLTAVAVVTDYRPRLLHCPGLVDALLGCLDSASRSVAVVNEATRLLKFATTAMEGPSALHALFRGKEVLVSEALVRNLVAGQCDATATLEVMANITRTAAVAQTIVASVDGFNAIVSGIQSRDWELVSRAAGLCTNLAAFDEVAAPFLYDGEGARARALFSAALGSLGASASDLSVAGDAAMRLCCVVSNLLSADEAYRRSTEFALDVAQHTAVLKVLHHLADPKTRQLPICALNSIILLTRVCEGAPTHALDVFPPPVVRLVVALTLRGAQVSGSDEALRTGLRALSALALAGPIGARIVKEAAGPLVAGIEACAEQGGCQPGDGVRFFTKPILEAWQRLDRPVK